VKTRTYLALSLIIAALSAVSSASPPPEAPLATQAGGDSGAVVTEFQP
jgi:hypothetical protein